MSFREKGQFLPQRGEFVSHARSIDAGSYKLDDNRFIIVSYTAHPNLGKSSVKAEILEPQTVKYSVNGRLWRGHSMSIESSFLGRRKPAAYTERYLLVKNGGAILLDERTIREPRVGYFSLSHFRDGLDKISDGAKATRNKDVDKIRYAATPFPQIIPPLINGLLLMAEKNYAIVKNKIPQPNGAIIVTTSASFDLVTENVHVSRVKGIYRGGFSDTTYNVEFQNKSDTTGTHFTFYEKKPIEKSATMGIAQVSDVAPTIADRVLLVDTLGALDATYLHRY